MGGFGSGMYRLGTKPTTGSFWKLNIAALKKAGALAAESHRFLTATWQGRHQSASITLEVDLRDDPAWVHLSYHTKQMRETHTESIMLTTTSPHYGGLRWWFLCPQCYTRVAMLYLRQHIACRTCCNIAYPSQRESTYDRKLSQAWAIHRELDPNQHYTLDAIPPKPKYMHYRTYYKKLKQRDQLASIVFGYMYKSAQELKQRIYKIEGNRTLK